MNALEISHGTVPGRLTDVSLILAQGTLAGLVGPNGSGKSTLLQLAAGILPGAGDILISALQNTAYAGDVRREAAIALGLIGDSAAVPALRAAFSSEDPYLSEAARAALRRLRAPVN